ncbi:hypothetical protein [Chryseobacterium sp. 8AT]|uniref:hypothetical protein n=1 Tax=Chryseobacterium sp. 8AT TaxID=2653134 RepID=UPI0012F2B944|nr:hypothetical protein [Chryseobacterium sp. 8AT]VXB17117.1 conserved hypothetical protein [Chryseobacterium sp. 8AT]
MSIPLDTIYSYFETGDFPTQEEFKESWSSFWHKDEAIPMSKIIGLITQLQNKVDKTAFDNHALSSDSHINYLTKKDASNLNSQNIQSWKNVLGVRELLSNLATFDDGINTGNVYTKIQSDSKYMFIQDFLNDEKKILAEKIEALGLTILIEASEKDISEFAEHSDLYKFEANDFIAVPDGKGNFSLYLFKGGDKQNKANYLSTGLSNITIGMVEDLQSELNKIQVVQEGLNNLKIDLQTKADKITVEQELSKIKIVEDGLVNVNTNLQSKADKVVVQEQINALNTDLQIKADKDTVYTKDQSDSKYMFLQDFLNDDKKIIAEKIEALGLTTLIEASEKSILEFAERSDLYKFEDNDFIAVPDSRGNFALYLFKGGNKQDKNNYLPTGLSNITVGMVEGLQTEINKIEFVQGELINVNTKLQIKADKAAVLEQFGTFTTNLETKVDKATAQLEFNKIKVVEDGLIDVNSNLLIKADKATVLEQFDTLNTNLETKVDVEKAQVEFNKIKAVETGVANLNTNLQTKADKAAVLEQFGTFTTNLETKADKATVQQEVNRIKVVEDRLVDVNADLQTKADKAAVLEQFGTFTTNLETKADKATAQLEFNKIKVVEDRLVDVNADLLIKADKSTVLEQFNTLNADLETKIDAETAQIEFNKIKAVETGVATLNTNLQTKADKSTILEQFNTLNADLETKVDVETAQLEFNKIKVVETGVANLNTNLQTKADKASVLEQFGTFTTSIENKADKSTVQELNANLQTKADKATIEPELNKIKIVEEGLANANVNLQIKADKSTVQELNVNLQNKADKNALENHLWSPDSHVSYLTRRDASNLDYENIYSWKTALGILDSTEPGRKYKIYRALLRIDEKSFEPQFIVLENTIGDIYWRREETGFYTGVLEKAFPEGKVWINSKINIPFKRSSPVDCMSVRMDDHVVGLNVFMIQKDEYIPIDMVGDFGNIEIFVYNQEK